MAKGIIVVNPFLVPKESIHQAERLKEEFKNLGVETEIVSDAYLCSALKDGKLQCEYENCQFAVYLDKDKYQSEILEKMGVRLFNSHSAIRICDDKAQTYIKLSGLGYNIPETIFAPLCYRQDLEINEKIADKIASELGYPVIVKESFGSMGKGVFKADNKSELLKIMDDLKCKPHMFQQYIDERKGVDVRIIVIGGKAVAYMERENKNDFRSNVAQGGEGKAIKNLPYSFIETAEKVAKELHLDYCGVDLLYGKNNQPYICEVNSNAFIGGIEKTTKINIAKLYCQYILKEISK